MPKPTTTPKPTIELRKDRVGFDSPEYRRRIYAVREQVRSLQEKAVLPGSLCYRR